MSALFGPIFGVDVITGAVDDRAWLRAMCRAEQALAEACAEVGLIDGRQAELIGRACAEVAELDPAGLGQAAVADGNPVIALVARLRAAVGATGTGATGPGEASGQTRSAAAGAVHLGATSQDIIDTAAMLISVAALDAIVAELRRAADAAAALAAEHRDTPMVARTLLQQALPTTFGALAVTWTAGLDRAAGRLTELRGSGLAVQLAGAAGTLAGLHPHGPAVRAGYARRLGLADPGRGWHAERSRLTELASALAVAAATVGSVATDIVLLAQTELGELSEAAGGSSSAMPHKHNPIAAVTARAAAQQAPGLLATLLHAASGPELQRAAGGWHAEWLPLTRLFEAAAGAAGRLATSLTGLRVHPEAMRTNLDAGRGVLLAERVTARLSPTLGPEQARELTRQAAGHADGFRAGLVQARLISAGPAATNLTDAELDELLDPLRYLGHACDEVDAYLKGRQP